jgi:hypothetical protein
MFAGDRCEVEDEVEIEAEGEEVWNDGDDMQWDDNVDSGSDRDSDKDCQYDDDEDASHLSNRNQGSANGGQGSDGTFSTSVQGDSSDVSGRPLVSVSGQLAAMAARLRGQAVSGDWRAFRATLKAAALLAIGK